jgi:hypothetical protein
MLLVALVPALVALLLFTSTLRLGSRRPRSSMLS